MIKNSIQSWDGHSSAEKEEYIKRNLRELNEQVADIPAALEAASTAVQSATEAAASAAAAIAASKGKYKKVSSLPTASADTIGYIFLTPGSSEGVYNMSYTEQNGDSYSWEDCGTTELSLDGVATKEEVSQLGQEVNGINVNVGTWSVGSVNNPSGGHIPDYSSNRRMRTAELTIGQSATYLLKVNPGYKFGLIVVNKRASLVWDSELSIDLAQGDVYRVVLREDPDPSNTNIYSGWTQTQIDALIAASGFQMFVKSSFDELKEELEAEINAVAISAIKSEQYCEIDVDVWPRPNSYIQDGLIFFLDGKDFTSGSWVDKVGNSSFALTDCAKDGNGVKFNGTSSHGTTDASLSFPSQQYTIEMVVKGEKEVSASSDSQIIFNTKNSGDFALGFGMAGTARLYTFQAGTTNANLGYLLPSALGVKRLSVNKNLCVVNEGKITSGGGVGNWNAGTKVTIGANASGNNWYFKGTIYAIRIYNRLLSESEMKANQMFDKANYNL